MGASEDARARATLNAMQARLAKGPHDALGLASNANPSEIRTAFLELTKVYHPARFSRLSAEIQWLSNEVFLGLRGAHDALVKATGPAPRTNRSTEMPPIHASGTGPLRAPQSPPEPPMVPPNPPTQPPTVRPGPALRAGAGSSSGFGARASAPQPAAPAPRKPGAASEPNFGGGSGGTASAVRPTAGPPATQTRPPTPQPVVSRVATPIAPTPRAPTPATGVRQTTAPVPTRAGSPPVTAARPAAPAAHFDADAEHKAAMELMRKGQWTAAVQAMQTLATQVPTAKKFRSLLCYARAREAQGAGRIDDAIAELQRALQIDPEFTPAKTALAELQSRRR